MSARPLVFVCRDCSRRSDEPDLRKALKKQLCEDGLKKEVRIVRTECMGLCPSDGVSVCEPGGECSSITGEKEREALYARLTDLIESRG